MNLQKDNYYRSVKYLKWVSQQPSVLSGLPADDPHHIKGKTYGTKPPDWACIPLTREEHAYLHSVGHVQWERENGSQCDYLVKFMIDNFETIQEFL